MERLDKILADTGRWSRKEARILVQTSHVKIDGRFTKDAGEKCSDEACVQVDGMELPRGKFLYVMLHKPAGYITSTEDPRERTVMELLPEEFRNRGLFPVGRLDKDTEGLLIFTNDGAIAHHLISPRHHVQKRYFVRVDGELNQADVEAFDEGITLKDETRCLPAGLKILENLNEAIVTIQEGKYHQVKRMLASRGKPVDYLRRVSMGAVVLDPKLAIGSVRLLSERERKSLDMEKI